MSNSFKYNPIDRSGLVATGNSTSIQRFVGQEANSYVAGSKSTIQISSADSFLLSDDSYLRFKFTPTLNGVAVGGSNAVVMTTSGCVGAIDRMVVSVAGKPVDDINAYSLLNSVEVQRYPPAKKANLVILEQYNNPTCCQASGSTYVNHKPKSTFLQTIQAIPCPLLRSGNQIQLEVYWTNNMANIFTSAGTIANGFLISDLQFVGRFATPDPRYMQQITDNLIKGGVLSLPYVQTTSRSTNCNGSNLQQILLDVDIATSLQSLSIYFYNTTASSPLDNLADPGVIQYYFSIGSKQFPQSVPLKSSTSGTLDGEAFLHSLISANQTDSTGLPALTQSQWGANAFSLDLPASVSTDVFATGLSTVSDPRVRANITTSGNLPSTLQAIAMINTDVILTISAKSVTIDKVF